MPKRRVPWPLCLVVMLAAGPAAADPSSLFQQARARQAQAFYEEAAGGYEAFARESPAAGEAPQALEEAVVLRLGLGQVDQARADAALFARGYGARDPARAAHLGLAAELWSVEHEDWARGASALPAWLKAFERGAALDDRILAHAMLGRSYVKLVTPRKAEPEYAAVRDLWKDPAEAVRAIAPEGQPDGNRRLGRALNAVGEALFFFAEKKRRDVEAIRFPEFHGPDTQQGVLAHIRTKVPDWVQKKRPAIEAAEKEYLQVVQLQPAPPPRWVIASASRVGAMWGRFVAEFRAAPIPRAWKGHGAVPGTSITFDTLRGAYYGALDEASEPQRQVAKRAFSTCVRYSIQFVYDDAYARRCREWLGKNYPDELHPGLDEIIPRWRLVGGPEPLAPMGDPR